MIFSDGTGMINYTTASAMARLFEVEIEKVRTAMQMMASAREGLQGVFPSSWLGFSPAIEYCGRTFRFHEAADIEKLCYAYNLACWAAIAEKIQIWKVLSSSKADELRKLFEIRASKLNPDADGAVPWLTADAIQDVLQGWIDSLDDFMAEKVREEYDYWKPYRERRYKTDVFEKLNRRVIQEYAVDATYGGKLFDVEYNAAGHFTALDSIFHMLDGKGPLPGQRGPLVDTIRVSEGGVGETEYFSFRCYKNRNIHLVFKREDLLEKFNAVAGRNYLGQSKQKEADSGQEEEQRRIGGGAEDLQSMPVEDQ